MCERETKKPDVEKKVTLRIKCGKLNDDKIICNVIKRNLALIIYRKSLSSHSPFRYTGIDSRSVQAVD